MALLIQGQKLMVNCWLTSTGLGDMSPDLANMRPTARHHHSHLSSADIGDMGPGLDMRPPTCHHHSHLASADLGNMDPTTWHHRVMFIVFLRGCVQNPPEVR